jgi:hypothetical protein
MTSLPGLLTSGGTGTPILHRVNAQQACEKIIHRDFVMSYLLFILYMYIKNLIMKVKDIINQTIEERNTKTVYVPVADNIYHTGYSYRVRVRQKNKLVSKYFKNKKQAIQFRNGIIL